MRVRMLIALALFATASLLSSPIARADTTRQVSGTVACQTGKAVQGVWVYSSAGGARWADWTARSGAPWLADYSASITSSTATTSIRLDVGCGVNTDGSWWSTNLTSTTSVSGSKKLSALCTEAAGRGTRCKWWGNTVLIGMPYTGYWACPSGMTQAWCNSYPPSHPSEHHGEGDWTIDLYKNDGTVIPRVYARSGDSLKLSVKDYRTTCGTAGKTVKIKVDLNGIDLGWISYGHLKDVPTGYRAIGAPVANNKSIGTTYKWAKQSSDCWSVSYDSGVHTHFASDNASGYSCFWPYKMTSSVASSRLLGRLGAGGPSVAHSACP